CVRRDWRFGCGLACLRWDLDCSSCDFRLPVVDRAAAPVAIDPCCLPACLPESRDSAGQRQLTEQDAADLELAEQAAGPPGEQAAVVAARRAGIARQARQLGVVLFLLELETALHVAFGHLLASLLLRYPGFGCH